MQTLLRSTSPFSDARVRRASSGLDHVLGEVATSEVEALDRVGQREACADEGSPTRTQGAKGGCCGSFVTLDYSMQLDGKDGAGQREACADEWSRGAHEGDPRHERMRRADSDSMMTTAIGSRRRRCRLEALSARWQQQSLIIYVC